MKQIIHAVFLGCVMIAFAISSIAILVVLYWCTWDARPVLTQFKPYPAFLRAPAHTWEDAQGLELRAARPGQTVYRYVEYCLSRASDNDIRMHWRNGVIYQIPTVKGIGEKGCFKRTFATRVPDELSGKEVEFVVRASYSPNPLITQTVELPPYRLTIEK